jgi:tetratricopeptide (TPR) repeat protein
MATEAQALALAVEAHRRGDNLEAQEICSQLLKGNPRHAGALHLLGIIAYRAGRHDEAIDQLRLAVAAEPASAGLHYDLGTTYQFLGRLQEAVASYEEALRHAPDYPEAHSNLGLALTELGRLAEAVDRLRQAVRHKPAYAEAHNNLGHALYLQGHWDEAVVSLREAVRLKPDYAEAHSNLGLALARQGHFNESGVSYREVLRLQPDNATVHNDLGFVLKEQGHLAQALTSLREAIRLRPDYAEAHNNLGVVLTEEGHFDEALASLSEALRLMPEYVDGYNNLGLAYAAQGKLDEALAEHEKALALVPGHPQAHFFRALTWLQAGDFEQGWQEYEWRWKMPKHEQMAFSRPLWDGTPLAGRTILIYAEQGLGDTLQFIRFAAAVKQTGSTVIVACQKALLPLLARCAGIDRLVATGPRWPDCDVQAPLLSLPRILKTTLDTLPSDAPYLHADPGLVERWERELRPLPGFKVGIAWQGNPNFVTDRRRSIPLRWFAALSHIACVHLISLQKGPGSEQLPQLADRFTVLDLARRLDEDAGAFMDTAAVMKHLDLVITCDTASAHLAGGLGVPVWLALPFAPDWRWLLDRDDSPWYPTMRLFRQARWGDWEEVFQRMARQLREKLLSPAPAGTALVPIAPGELIDKITILQIKAERIADEAKRHNALVELAALAAARACTFPASPELTQLTAQLLSVNQALWDIEDAIRICEREQHFGPRFIELARSVYRQNDRRAALKRQINEMLGSKFVEEKSYASPTTRLSE